MTATTDLVLDPTLKGQIVKAKSLKDVATAIDNFVPEVVTSQTVAEWPKPLVLTDEQRDALDAVPSVFGVVHPDAPKVLTDDEMVALYAERETVRAALEPLKGRDEVIKEIVRHHMDLVAEQNNVALPHDIVSKGEVVAFATPRDASGHYILASKGKPERASIPGSNKEWSREYRAGAVSFAFAEETLLDMLTGGEITRDQYLSMTREKRVFDETKALDALRKDPASYLPIFQRVANRAADSTSMFVR